MPWERLWKPSLEALMQTAQKYDRNWRRAVQINLLQSLPGRLN